MLFITNAIFAMTCKWMISFGRRKGQVSELSGHKSRAWLANVAGDAHCGS